MYATLKTFMLFLPHELISVAAFGKEVRSLFPKNGVFWDVTPCGSGKNRRFGGT
jgi:hypothetical protein